MRERECVCVWVGGWVCKRGREEGERECKGEVRVERKRRKEFKLGISRHECTRKYRRLLMFTYITVIEEGYRRK